MAMKFLTAHLVSHVAIDKALDRHWLQKETEGDVAGISTKPDGFPCPPQEHLVLLSTIPVRNDF